MLRQYIHLKKKKKLKTAAKLVAIRGSINWQNPFVRNSILRVNSSNWTWYVILLVRTDSKKVTSMGKAYAQRWLSHNFV